MKDELGIATLKLDEDVDVRIDFNTLCHLEQEFGISFAKLGPRIEKDQVFDDLRRVIHVCLRRDAPGMTLDEAGLIMSRAIARGRTLPSMTRDVFEALAVALAGPKGVEGNAESGAEEVTPAPLSNGNGPVDTHSDPSD